MARKKSGGFNRVLNFIGLVDDEPRDIYEDEYASDNYGRPQAYAPQRSQSSRPRQEMTTRRSAAPSYEPTRTPRMSRSSSNRFDQPQRSNSQSARRSSSAPRTEARSGGYDYSPRTSRFGEIPGAAPSFEAEAPRATRSNAGRQRTVMFALHALEDCCDVIDHLIENTTVVLTMDDLDPKLMQRAVDTLSGAVFALRATIRKASEHTYLIAPNGVEVDETYEMDRRF